jgi:hypothetical protein
MKNEILSNLDNPMQLEKLYWTDKSAFKRAFNILYPELKDNMLISFWNVRLNFPKQEISWGTRKDFVFLVIASLVAGMIAKLPAIINIDKELFYSRNIGFIIFPVLSIYFAWKNKLSLAKIAFIVVPILAAIVFINSLPDPKLSDTSLLSCIHVILFLWSILGFAFIGEHNDNVEKRLRYLTYNGDVVVMTTLIVIAAGILSAATIGLFSLIGLEIKNFYFEYVVVFGLPAAPILGTYLTQTNPQLVGKVSPVIAKIFSPLVLIMLVIYLIAIIYSGKDPYNDRQFLMFFNGLLLGVLAIIFFSVAEMSKAEKSRMEILILFLLSVVTIIVNGIALSAILFRISEWGFTPNRTAVLGGNVIILINLLLVAIQLFKTLYRKADIDGVGKIISSYLPVYFIWAVIVTFVFPLIFAFR